MISSRSPIGAIAAVMLSAALLSSNAWAQCPVYSNQWEIPNSPYYVHALAVDGAGNVYAGDLTNGRIVKCTSEGTMLAQWGSFGTGDGQFSDSDAGFSIAIDESDNVYILDGGNKRVQKFTSSGAYVTQWPLQPDTSSLTYGYSRPLCIAVDRGGHYVYVSDVGTYHILKYTASGEFLAKWGSVGHDNGQFWHGPAGLAVDGAGHVYVAEAGQDVQVFTSDGGYITRWTGSPESMFWGIAVDKTGNVYVVDNGNGACCPSQHHRVKMFSSSGAFLCEWGSYGGADGQFMWPYYVAVNGAGDVFVSDRRIQKFVLAPVPATVTTWGKLKASYR